MLPRRLGGDNAVTTLLVALNVAVFLLAWVLAGFRSDDGMPDGAFSRALVLLPDVAATLRQPWRLLTYMFTQFSWLHLLFNALLLVSFAALCRIAARPLTVVALYLAGGLAGAVAYEISALAGAITGSYLVGSSASVMAMMVWLTVREPKMYVSLWGLGEVRALWVAMPLIVLGLVQGGAGSFGGFAAHLGGALAGLAIALCGGRGIRRAGRRAADKAQQAAAASTAPDPVSRLDELLDKIRISGYSSLSSREREELDSLSSKLKK